MHTTSNSFFGPGTVGWLVAGLALSIAIGFLIRRCLKKRKEKAAGKGAWQPNKTGITNQEQELTSKEIGRVCKEFALSKKQLHDETVSGELQHWFCPICLHGNKGRGAILELPCAHRVHAKCIENAFALKMNTCAVCGWDARSLFNKAPLPTVNLVKPTTNRGMQTPRIKGSHINIYGDDFSDNSSSDDSGEGTKAPV